MTTQTGIFCTINRCFLAARPKRKKKRENVTTNETNVYLVCSKTYTRYANAYYQTSTKPIGRLQWMLKRYTLRLLSMTSDAFVTYIQKQIQKRNRICIKYIHNEFIRSVAFAFVYSCSMNAFQFVLCIV